MSQSEELAKQILTAYVNGQIDLTNVPDLQKIVKDAAAQQMAFTYSTTDFHAKQEEALKHEQAWYHQEIDRILNDNLAKIDPQQLRHSITKQLEQQQTELRQQQAKLESMRKQQFWQMLMPTLAGFAVCLLLVTIIFFLLERLVYQGIWQGWGLHKLYATVLAIQPQHPYSAILLGLLGVIILAVAIMVSFLLLVEAVRQLGDFEPSKLLFWKKQKNTRW